VLTDGGVRGKGANQLNCPTRISIYLNVVGLNLNGPIISWAQIAKGKTKLFVYLFFERETKPTTPIHKSILIMENKKRKKVCFSSKPLT
jgi:hypothetical protein